MKKLIVFTLVLTLLFSGCGKAAVKADTDKTASEGGNYSDEMKIPAAVDLSAEDGADSVERAGDHQDSPYFNTLDFYNMKSSDTLTILEQFKTYQQTSEWSCGVCSALMVMNWYGKTGEQNEQTLARMRSNGEKPEGTSLRQLMDVFEGVGGFDLYTTFDCKENVHEVFTLEFVRETLAEGKPIIVGWNDWGGHWQVIIGYDTMGTDVTQDDVIIVADSYDTTDHNQDGYGVYGAERFLYNFTFYNFFAEEELNDMVFAVATPAEA